MKVHIEYIGMLCGARPTPETGGIASVSMTTIFNEGIPKDVCDTCVDMYKKMVDQSNGQV